LYKNANRKDLDISAVNLGIHVEWVDKTKKAIKATKKLKLKFVNWFFCHSDERRNLY